jgi:hypothetical protein
MSATTLIKKGLNFYTEYGAIRTVGAVAMFIGNGVNNRCRNVDEILTDDLGEGYSLSVRLKAAIRGMSADSYLWQGLDEAGTDAEQYICSNDPIAALNQKHIFQVHDKYVFQLMTQPHLGALPTLYGVIENGSFTPTPDSMLELDEMLENSEALVLKPARGGKGVGIYVVHSADDGLTINGEISTECTLSEMISDLDEYLVFEFLHQHEYAETIFSEATNTLRVHSVIDPETGDAGILRPIHRFGSTASKPTDNWSQDGYIAPIDDQTGVIQELVVVEGHSRSRLDHHPETGSRVSGVAVPHWQDVCELVCAAAELHRHAPLVGWDVVVTESGPVLIEANARPDEILLQLDEGLLTDSRVYQLLEEHL